MKFLCMNLVSVKTKRRLKLSHIDLSEHSLLRFVNARTNVKQNLRYHYVTFTYLHVKFKNEFS